jgi:hypothetical protein
VFKTLVFMRGEIRVVTVMFENRVPVAVIDGTRIPLNPLALHHIEQEQPKLYYLYEVLPP